MLFCDLAGFTSLSERLDAEDVAIVQDAYFESVRHAVGRHGGTLEKFIGDAAVAVFGVPTSGEHDAERAVSCGFAVVGAIEQLATRVGLEDGTLHVRVGMNTGEAVVHPAPSAGEAMVTGDVVNTAARLQSAAPLNGVLLGPETALAVAHAVELEAAGELDLKGKAQPVRASRAVVLLSEPERERAMGQLTAPTIGREAELSRVTRALDRCMAGESQRLTVVAPPGTGKSRLLDEVASARERTRSRDSTGARATRRPLGVSPSDRARRTRSRGRRPRRSRSDPPKVDRVTRSRARGCRRGRGGGTPRRFRERRRHRGRGSASVGPFCRLVHGHRSSRRSRRALAAWKTSTGPGVTTERS